MVILCTSLQAETELTFALNNTPAGHVSNRRRILVYLIPIRLILHQVRMTMNQVRFPITMNQVRFPITMNQVRFPITMNQVRFPR